MQAIKNGPFHDLRVGGLDPNRNKKIASLIARTATFVVYLDPDDDVVYLHGRDFGELPRNFDKVVERFSVLHAEPVKHLPASVRSGFRTLLARSIAQVLIDGSTEGALKALDKAEDYLRVGSNKAARWIYLSAAIPTTMLAIVAAVVFQANRSALDTWLGDGFTVAAVAALMGAVGAFLSIFLRLAKVEIDVGTGTRMLILECTLRVLVGVVVAAMVGLAIRANLALGFTTEIAGGFIGTKMLIGLLSGASERAMPTMMKKFDNTLEDGTSGDEGRGPAKPTPRADPESASGASGRTGAAAASPAPARVDPTAPRDG